MEPKLGQVDNIRIIVSYSIFQTAIEINWAEGEVAQWHSTYLASTRSSSIPDTRKKKKKDINLGLNQPEASFHFLEFEFHSQHREPHGRLATPPSPAWQGI